MMMVISWLMLFLATPNIRGDFSLIPVTQRVTPGVSVHQACSAFDEPIFIEWYQNERKVGSCLFHANTTSTTMGDQKYKLFIGMYRNHSVCHLAIQSVTYDQSGEYMCKAVYASSSGDSVSAIVLVFKPITELRMKIDNETSLHVGGTANVECISHGGVPSPKLRLQIGGHDVSQVSFMQRTDSYGRNVATLTANIRLINSHQWNILLCHVDMDAYKSINQTFKVIHLKGYEPIEP